MTAAQAAELAILRNGFSIRHERRAVIQGVTRLYTSASNYVDVPTEEIVGFEKDETPPPVPPSVSPANASLPQIVNHASDRHLIDADLITSVIHAESNANPRAVSPKGAQGLMQLMPRTASKLGVNDTFDPASNVDGGTRYLRELLERYNYDLIKALAAYNAGPQRVEKYRGVPPYRETHAYVARIIREFNRKKLAEQNANVAAATTAQVTRSSNTKRTSAAQPATQHAASRNPRARSSRSITAVKAAGSAP